MVSSLAAELGIDEAAVFTLVRRVGVVGTIRRVRAGDFRVPGKALKQLRAAT